jgi:hypothetical protein
MVKDCRGGEKPASEMANLLVEVAVKDNSFKQAVAYL